jgi:hypothetical protein
MLLGSLSFCILDRRWGRLVGQMTTGNLCDWRQLSLYKTLLQQNNEPSFVSSWRANSYGTDSSRRLETDAETIYTNVQSSQLFSTCAAFPLLFQQRHLSFILLYFLFRYSGTLSFTISIEISTLALKRNIDFMKEDLRFPLRWRWRMVSSGMLRRVALVRTDVSEEPSASFIRVTLRASFAGYS